MKLAVSNIAWAAEQDEAVYAGMRELGFSGLEIAPTRIFPERPYERIREAAVWREGLRTRYGFEVPSMQSIWYGRTEHIFGSPEEREALLEYTRQAIGFAAAVGCRNLVFGCPRNRSIPEDADPDIAVTFFREAAEYALARGAVIGFEANPPVYNTNYMNTTSQALLLVEKVASEGFRLNLDIGTMLWNREEIAILAGKMRYVSHVHISEPNLARINRRKLHTELAAFLSTEGYEHFVSIEMGRTADLQAMFEVMSYVAKQFG